jgi:hypothetical protein
MASNRFSILRGADVQQSRVQDNVSGLVAPVAKALQNTPIMGAAPPVWTVAQLLNAFTTFPTLGFGPPSWQLDALGYVHLRGLAFHVAGVAALTDIFVLPIAMRPSLTHCSSPDTIMQGLLIFPDGRVQCVAATGAGGAVCLDFIFQAGG